MRTLFPAFTISIACAPPAVQRRIRSALILAMAVCSSAARAEAPAEYSVRLMRQSPPTLEVTAILPAAGNKLEMATTRPAGIPVLDANGWPGLVRNLQVFDASGARDAA